ncbi:uncharacterized protein NECHADRAFT_55460 [Fusarium vanettenii 77-13-4]|uniref:Peptidase M20 dimerisation domain-containing protein n=1 Tax=Fusarium vanettenii (strain ATCC MYA-4622 / CBS 123669 / FGSC 9596 / NRRL 45880 / 77-13-4) TaxID=660122 RepID=C7ZC34_FUSV7|nr:uncharacterized protein NECHADRAFT_56807 [Fusarium vanettenii 77-13-4]XP_003044133.1 uncharacterized protein NECHADRAFT_55460 [Fusarium vanettenii 77-13-4]EEU33350.1 hypothetical protein NECHADRAFT_56807 [Fusarium vanettenii 77-13-4]EEU38420.1 hypothetical protein NECHADRAFT_55460 [Fusarium vanettenii 77-13-4]
MSLVRKLVLLATILGAFGLPTNPDQKGLGYVGETPAGPPTCLLPPVLEPPDDGLPSGATVFSGAEALETQVRRHQAIVRVPTVCYDDLGDFDTDPRWNRFHRLHEVLQETYPAVHGRARLDKVNTFGLVYTIQGSDPSLQPALLTAHQDVVPAGDPCAWTHPPFNATFDGEWLWGRGSADDKASLTGLLSAVEALASISEWTPRRSIILAFGFDEECSGYRGAGSIAKYLLSQYGHNGLALILDEGTGGISPFEDGTRYAPVGVLEKGHVDVTFDLRVRGGHSSTPLPHSGIGIVAEIVTALEAHVYEPRVTTESPVYSRLVCQMEYSPESDPELFRHVRSGDLGRLATELSLRDAFSRYSVTSSVAVTTIQGGLKINALPEAVTLGANFRVAPHDSIAKILQAVLEDISGVVHKYGLTVTAYEDDQEYQGALTNRAELEATLSRVGYNGAGDNGTLTLTASEKFPVTPQAPTHGAAWDVLAGTIRHSFAADDGLVVPFGDVMMGNTDTRHYLDLSPSIYRWLPLLPGDMVDYHAVNERIRMGANLKMAEFYYDLIRNLGHVDL